MKNPHLTHQLRICADHAVASPDECTYLNSAARPMLREAADEIERLRVALHKSEASLLIATLEIERLRAQLVEAEKYNGWHQEALLEIERRRAEQVALSNAYLRLRGLIPGAFDTPHGPTPEQVWDVTERALKHVLTGRKGDA